MSADAAADADAAAERRLNHSIPVRTSYGGYNNGGLESSLRNDMMQYFWATFYY